MEWVGMSQGKALEGWSLPRNPSTTGSPFHTFPRPLIPSSPHGNPGFINGHFPVLPFPDSSSPSASQKSDFKPMEFWN